MGQLRAVAGADDAIRLQHSWFFLFLFVVAGLVALYI